VNRREFLHVLAAASAAGLALDAPGAATRNADAFYRLPRFGNVHLLHFTDCHAQLLPTYYREPGVNLGVGDAAGRPPHLVGEALLRRFGIKRGSREAHAFTSLDFVHAARTYGKVGGFAHLATLIASLKADRPGALVLDGGDTWQGSATSLWSEGADMIEAARLLGVDVMTGHWEFTYGAERVKAAIERELKGAIEFVAQNVRTADFGDPVFAPYALREVNGIPIAIIGQAFPYTPIAHPRYFVPDWSFGIREQELQQTVNDARRKASVVVLLSHNGMDVDLKLASRVTGIDVILGGHTHDGVPRPIPVANASGTTLVTNAGCNGKFLAVADLEVRSGRLADIRYRLLPVFANLLPADPTMAQLIARLRAPHAEKLGERLGVTEGLLYRRGTFNGSFDQLILDALMAEKDTEIAFSPGFRWGTTLLPGQPITYEQLLDQTAITYPYVTVNEFTGETIKAVLEDVADNLFNPDPYYQQGGDMVRVGGLTYSCDPNARLGSRIGELRLHGTSLDADKRYKVAGWAPVSEEARASAGEPIWEVVARYLKAQKTIAPRRLNRPRLLGVAGNPGMA
jgi:sulfur-oxidizing protein SoxB